MSASLLLFSVALALNGPTATPTSASVSGDPVLKHCLVSLIEEVQLPGREPGVLISRDVKEGMQVNAGDILGHIDDTEATMAKRIKSLEYDVAKEQATNDVDVRYAAAAAGVAKFAWEKAVLANKKSPNSVPEVEVRRLQLDHRRAELQIEKAQLDRRVASLTADTKAAEVDAAENSIQRRQLKCPIDGVVVQIYRHLGEWVPPGEPVFRVVRVNRLRIEGFLNTSEFGPEEIGGKTVTVDADLARGRRLKFPGKIVFVSPLVAAGGEYKVWAEVDNRAENEQWLLRPGLNVTMTIHLK